MFESYFELRSYTDCKTKFLKLIIMIFLATFVLLSFSKVRKYDTFNLIESDNKLYIMCDKNCKKIEYSTNFMLNNQIVDYKLVNKLENVFEVKTTKKIKIDNVQQIGIYDKKISAIKYLFNIFTEKGVTSR